MNRIADIPLSSFEEPVRIALAQYSESTNGKVAFDIDAACKLELTPDKPNSARSTTVVQHLGETAGNLCVIVFDWEDGTGDESAYTLRDTMASSFYPPEPKVVPRSKAAVHTEAHFTIATHSLKRPDEDPVMYAGHLDLVSFRKDRLSRLAYLGQHLPEFNQAIAGKVQAQPQATLTTGFQDGNGERFGDPHAVFNARPFIQVCAFVAVTNEMAQKHASMFEALNAREPILQF